MNKEISFLHPSSLIRAYYVKILSNIAPDKTFFFHVFFFFVVVVFSVEKY